MIMSLNVYKVRVVATMIFIIIIIWVKIFTTQMTLQIESLYVKVSTTLVFQSTLGIGHENNVCLT